MLEMMIGEMILEMRERGMLEILFVQVNGIRLSYHVLFLIRAKFYERERERVMQSLSRFRQ